MTDIPQQGCRSVIFIGTGNYISRDFARFFANAQNDTTI